MKVGFGLVVVVCALAGCVESKTVTCANGIICPEGHMCSPVGGCLLDEQVRACTGKQDNDECTFSGVPNGRCNMGSCVPAGCGNGRMEELEGEVCDDGNQMPGDGCSADCRSNETCGNGVLDVLSEGCDSGDQDNGDADGCQANCIQARCGDGFPDAEFNEGCDTGTANSNAADAACRPNCQPQRCGDGIVDLLADEVCDDGNLAAGDGCTPDCKSTEVCGNDYPDILAGELCDDGNKMGGDGCTLACGFEPPYWSEAASVVKPPARSEVMAAYDLGRNRLVVFGGYRPNGTYLDETWEADGVATWANVTPKESLISPRFGGAIAYDSKRDRLVMFGGTSGSGHRNDTWIWDGLSWTEITPGTGNPQVRYQHSMAYDAKRDRMVMFGGAIDQKTWEWDGTQWADVTPATGTQPPLRKQQGMAYDAKRGKIVLFGGANANETVRYNDTWEWDGTAWTDVTPASGNPLVRQGLAMAFDAVRGHVIMFGGWAGGGTMYADTWEWTGTAWLDITPVSGNPTPRYHHSMTADPLNGRVLLLMGETQSVLTNEIWAWNGSTWSPVADPIAPPIRANHDLAYDSIRGRVVMFGGRNGSGPVLADTWEFDGHQWFDVTPVSGSPPGLVYHAMAFDAARKKTVLFGGYTGSGGSYGKTWTWNGTAWTDVTPGSGNPTPRSDHLMVWDAAHQVVVMVAGADDNNELNETWTWNGTAWTNVTPATGNPPARYGHGLAYDAARGVVVMFGGRTADTNQNNNDTWEWNGTTWTNKTPTTGSPSKRQSRTLGYDSNRRRVILWGGFDGSYRSDTWEWDGTKWTFLSPLTGAPPARSQFGIINDDVRGGVLVFAGTGEPGSTQRNDTWVFRYRSEPEETCRFGIDADHDGANGCADPDCWGYCTPLCPPGTQCGAGTPKCGDGTCSSLENCRLCPGDCGACTAVCGDSFCDSPETTSSCPGDCP